LLRHFVPRNDRVSSYQGVCIGLGRCAALDDVMQAIGGFENIKDFCLPDQADGWLMRRRAEVLGILLSLSAYGIM
jgi:hypothetical protein